MAAKKPRLGRGLDVLIAGGVTKKDTPEPTQDTLPTPEGFREIEIDKIEPSPHQPRREMVQEQVTELAESIRQEGLLQPIVVREVEGKYLLIAGERRWRACTSLGMKRILARVVKVSESSAAVISLIENLQRENLNPVEESLGYASLMHDFDLTQEAVSERVGKPRSSVANALRLLQLEREIQGYLAKGMLSVGHAKVLLGLEDGAQRSLLARRIVERGLSVRETERLVQGLKRGRSPGDTRTRQASEDAATKDLEKRLQRHLSTKVQLKHGPKHGRIVIEYFGNEDLQRLLERLGIGENA